MPFVLKKPLKRQAKSPQKGRNKRSAKVKSSRRSLTSRAADLAERKKIGKTLDVSAFLTHHEKNSASATHWETKD